ncbi:MAG: hypothetical protein IT447_13365 [Phycisphaerales bacterium]|nr:hypothetical protein [Phycisphaerales bacterium]
MNKLFQAAALLLAMVNVSSAAVALVEGGKPTGRIVVPDEATAGETFAAEELQTLSKK